MSSFLPLLLLGCLPPLEPPADTGGDVNSCHTRVPESGSEPVRLDVLPGLPFTFCGELETTGNDSAAYTGDRDLTEFVLNEGGSYRLYLRWSASSTGDYDFFLFEGDDEIGRAASLGYPEIIDIDFIHHTPYTAIVVGWEGVAGEWQVTVNAN